MLTRTLPFVERQSSSFEFTSSSARRSSRLFLLFLRRRSSLAMRPAPTAVWHRERHPECFVVRLNIIPLLDVLLANRGTLRAVVQKNARVKLVYKLIDNHPSVRPCFGRDYSIERNGGSNKKLIEILRVPETRYDELRALETKHYVSPARLREAKENFAESFIYEEARRKADELFCARGPSTSTESSARSQAVKMEDSIATRSVPVEAFRPSLGPAAGNQKSSQRGCRGGRWAKGARSMTKVGHLSLQNPRTIESEERLKQRRTKFGIEICKTERFPSVYAQRSCASTGATNLPMCLLLKRTKESSESA